MDTLPAGEVLRPAEGAAVRALCRHPGRAAGVLMIQGEAGIGKSALLQDGLREAAQAGHRILRSVAVRGEREMAYAGLLELLAGMPGDTWADLPEPQRDALDVVLQHRPGDAARLTPQTVGMAVASVLRRYAERGPLLLAIDDLQWIDGDSLDALSFAARRVDGVPVLLAATVRTPARWRMPDFDDVAPVAVEAVSLAAERQHLITLTPLDQQQLRTLLHTTHGLDLSAAEADRVRRWTRGNTFWTLRVGAEMALPAGTDSAPRTGAEIVADWWPDDDLPVPDLARTLARRWIETAPADTVDALVTVAAAGRLPVLAAVAALDPVVADAGAALDAAVVAGLVIEDQGHLMPAHPLFGEATRLSIPPVRRAELHRRLGALSTDLHRRARHLALAAGGGCDEEAAAAMEVAAVSAAAHGDTPGAGKLATAAVRLTPPENVPAGQARRVLAAEYLTETGAVEQAWRVLAPVGPVEVGEPLAPAGPTEVGEPLAERVLPLRVDLLAARGDLLAARATVTAALNRAPGPSGRRALALGIAADERYGDATRLALAAEAAADAERCAASPSVTHRALRALATAHVEAGAGLDPALFDKLTDIERQWEVPRVHLRARALLGVLSRYDDQLDQSRPLLRECLARARHTGDRDGADLLRLHLAEAERLAGDLDTAVELLDEVDAPSDSAPGCVAGSVSGGVAAPAYLTVAVRGAVLVTQGRLAEAAALADAHASRLADRRTDGRPSRDRLSLSYLNGVVALRRGQTATAVAELGAARDEADALGVHEPSARFLLDADLAEALVLAQRYPQALAVAADLAVRGGARPVLAGVSARVEGLVAMAHGDLVTAAERLRDAVERQENCPIPGELGRTLLVLGRVERRRRSRRRAQACLERAAAIFQATGDVGRAGQVAEELERLSGRRSSHILTEVERRVAELLADGATTRNAASQLFVSVRTVEAHVTAIYRKLGVRSRAELARAVITDARMRASLPGGPC